MGQNGSSNFCQKRSLTGKTVLMGDPDPDSRIPHPYTTYNHSGLVDVLDFDTS